MVDFLLNPPCSFFLAELGLEEVEEGEVGEVGEESLAFAPLALLPWRFC